MSSPRVARFFTLALLAMLWGCKPSGEGYEFDESLSGPKLTGDWVYDTGTVCTVGDATMHCCPPGMALIGMHVTDNVFKCAQLTGTQGSRYLDVDTTRNGMHACPLGGVMVGLHVNNNQIACQTSTPGRTVEHVDGAPATADNYPMHVCPGRYALSGVLVHNNMYTCDS